MKLKLFQTVQENLFLPVSKFSTILEQLHTVVSQLTFFHKSGFDSVEVYQTVQFWLAFDPLEKKWSASCWSKQVAKWFVPNVGKIAWVCGICPRSLGTMSAVIILAMPVALLVFQSLCGCLLQVGRINPRFVDLPSSILIRIWVSKHSTYWYFGLTITIIIDRSPRPRTCDLVIWEILIKPKVTVNRSRKSYPETKKFCWLGKQNKKERHLLEIGFDITEKMFEGIKLKTSVDLCEQHVDVDQAVSIEGGISQLFDAQWSTIPVGLLFHFVQWPPEEQISQSWQALLSCLLLLASRDDHLYSLIRLFFRIEHTEIIHKRIFSKINLIL